MFDPRPLCCSSLTTAVGGTKDTNIVDSESPYRGTNQGAEERYPRMEKLILALVTAARKLRPYFQAHTIEVPTEYPMKQVLHKPEVSGRLMKWAIELSEFDIKYKPKNAIKG